jgi:fucose permease
MTRELKLNKPITFFSVIMARVSMISASMFVILLLGLHLLEPSLDPTWRFISEYMLEEHGWMMVLAFFALALSLACLFIILLSQSRNVPGYIGLGLLLLAAIGLAIAAVYPPDPVTVSEDAMSDHGRMHVLGASLDWTPFAALLISISLARYKDWFPIRRHLFITASIPVLLTFAFIASIASASGNIGPGVYAGLIGRLLLISYCGWIFIIARHSIRVYNQRTA